MPLRDRVAKHRLDLRLERVVEREKDVAPRLLGRRRDDVDRPAERIADDRLLARMAHGGRGRERARARRSPCCRRRRSRAPATPPCAAGRRAAPPGTSRSRRAPASAARPRAPGRPSAARRRTPASGRGAAGRSCSGRCSARARRRPRPSAGCGPAAGWRTPSRLLADRELDAHPVVDRPAARGRRDHVVVLLRGEPLEPGRAHDLEPERAAERDGEQEREDRDQQADPAIRQPGLTSAAAG